LQIKRNLAKKNIEFVTKFEYRVSTTNKKSLELLGLPSSTALKHKSYIYPDIVLHKSV